MKSEEIDTRDGALRLARHIAVRGVVQGVGFRPFVFRLASEFGIKGWILNGESGVEVHAEASDDRLAAFLHALRTRAPVAAKVTGVSASPTDVEGFDEFQIRSSRRRATPTARISPDLCVCAECLREMNDPANRRYAYPYINCTNCGPRYSIIERLPYDRSNTTMAAWQLCDACRAEYGNPFDRRYHAQPIACNRCGPDYELIEPGKATHRGEEAMCRAARRLREGWILAIKGIGGYHLACDARNLASVTALRHRKFRKEKPFAVMVSSVDAARSLARLTDEHVRLLTGTARPIVLADALTDMPGVAPGSGLLGIMLPYAPLHHLLFQYAAPCPLVLTSANRSSEPLAYRDDDALNRLVGIADGFLVGRRPIARRVDDSVVAVHSGRRLIIRRARGYAPSIVTVLPSHRPILALGADRSNAVALVIEGRVLVSQHIGELGDLEVDRAFEQTIEDLLEMYEVDRRELIVAHDLHPQYTSTQFAKRLHSRRQIAVQHHHAHVASVLAEHDLLDEPVIGVAMDGTGYGTDGTIWGFELFSGSVRSGFQRRASLRPLQMPGGDAAARFPVQAAAGFLHQLDSLPDMEAEPFCFPRRFRLAMQLLDKNVRCFRTTSAGRLFDAVAALLGFTREITFQGQAAVWLENLARTAAPQPPYDFPDFDHRALLSSVIADRLEGRCRNEIAHAFHAALAREIGVRVGQLCQEHGVRRAVLSGGVFQNELLLDLLCDQLDRDAGTEVLTNRQVPVGDGGICLGQAALAASPPF